jgi:hypothetical protein
MRKKITDDNLSLEAVSAMFAEWRSNREKRESIPHRLWQAAASQCETHPISHVCRHLRLSFVSLKEHMNEEKPSGEKFVELSIGCLSGEWRLECDRPDGGKLTIIERALIQHSAGAPLSFETLIPLPAPGKGRPGTKPGRASRVAG